MAANNQDVDPTITCSQASLMELMLVFVDEGKACFKMLSAALAGLCFLLEHKTKSTFPTQYPRVGPSIQRDSYTSKLDLDLLADTHGRLHQKYLEERLKVDYVFQGGMVERLKRKYETVYKPLLISGRKFFPEGMVSKLAAFSRTLTANELQIFWQEYEINRARWEEVLCGRYDKKVNHLEIEVFNLRAYRDMVVSLPELDSDLDSSVSSESSQPQLWQDSQPWSSPNEQHSISSLSDNIASRNRSGNFELASGSSSGEPGPMKRSLSDRLRLENDSAHLNSHGSGESLSQLAQPHLTLADQMPRGLGRGSNGFGSNRQMKRLQQLERKRSRKQTVVAEGVNADERNLQTSGQSTLV
jgi:hypothetical protein